ncbi:MAG TPA: cyanase [Acidocella sp.]|nr:cyanase [Acidocella sp.]
MNKAKAALGETIRSLMKQKGLSWASLAQAIGQSPVWTCAACLGQMSMTAQAAETTAALLGLSATEAAVLQDIPYRGALPTEVPTDPLVYRFHELVSVYGTTWKELIQEEFGDGIMSAIDFNMSLEREPDSNGDRVKIVMSGKFLPYKRY